MKKLEITPMIYCLILVLNGFLIGSCTADQDVFLDAVLEPEEPIIEAPGELGEIATEPCDFSLDSLTENSSLSIDCKLDLNGSTITLPQNVTLTFNGGEITNGTLFFGFGGKIDGDLLNHTLDIMGEVTLNDESFSFYPERWDITQGETTDEKALANKNNLNKAINLVHSMGASIFVIDNMDAYLDVVSVVNNAGAMALESILLPSNFNLIMSDETHLRVQPNGSPSYILMAVYKGVNITVTGGNLYGDRWEHDYTPFTDINGNNRDEHGWGNVLHVIGGKNITFDGININNSIGDGFSVYGSRIRNADGSVREGEMISENVTIRNSVIKGSRRNGMSLLDGNGILVENCKILDTAQGENPPGVKFSSAGTWPKYGISFEAYREVSESGELIEYARIENVTLRGNTFEQNSAGDVVLYTCSNITIEGNTFDSKISNIAAHDIIIRNNYFKARIDKDGDPYNHAIAIGSFISDTYGELNYNYAIYANTIEGYGNGMILAGDNFEVFDNNLVNCKNSIGLDVKLYGGEFYNNSITSSIQYAVGYFSRGAELRNVQIRNENVNVEYRPINLRQIIADSNDPLMIINSELNSITQKENFIENSQNITITNNSINTGFVIDTNSINIIIENNN